MKIKRYVSVILSALFLLGLFGTVSPAARAADITFNGNINVTNKAVVKTYSDTLQNPSVSAKISSGSGNVSYLNATVETKNGYHYLYLIYTGKKPGTTKVNYTFTYYNNSKKYTKDWSINIKIADNSKPYCYYLDVASYPNKTTYEIGEKVSKAGLLIGAYWHNPDNSTYYDYVPESDYSLSPSVLDKAGNVKVTVTAKLRGSSGSTEKFKTDFTVTVNQPTKRPSVTKNPTGETVKTGDSCNFTARAERAEKVYWYFVDPDGDEIEAKTASASHPGLKVEGYNEEKLKLSKIPASLDGWQVYATFTNIKGSTDTKKAGIIVSDAHTATPDPTASPTPTPTPSPTPTPTPSPTPTVVPMIFPGSVPVTAAPVIVETEDDGEQTDGGEGTEFYAIGANCLVNGEPVLILHEEAEITVVPALPEGLFFDGWKVNGIDAGTDPELTLTLNETALIEVVYHEERKITCTNCYFQFCNGQNRASGDKLQAVSFELDYENPVTKEPCPGGKISGYVMANIPKNKKIDHWLINGVEFHFNNLEKYFRITDLDEAATFEVVFR